MTRMLLVFSIMAPAFFIQPAKAQAPDCLSLAVAVNQTFELLADHFVTAMKARNLCFKIRYMPPKRASFELRQGTIDGELFRIASYRNIFGPTAVMVPEPLISGAGLTVFRKDKTGKLDDFQTRPAAVVGGTKWAQDATQDFDNVFIVEKGLSGLNMLRKGRVDIVFIDNVTWDYLAPRFPGLQARHYKDLTAYMYLSTLHVDRVSEISAAIKDHRDKEGGLAQVLHRFAQQN